jgi:hypothetical protein
MSVLLDKPETAGLRFDTHDDALNFAAQLVNDSKDWLAVHDLNIVKRYKEAELEIVFEFRVRPQRDGATLRLVNAARIGRVAARSPEARAKHAASRRRQAAACSEWDPSSQPAWLTSEVFSQQIQQLLANVPTAAIRSRLGVSRWYAAKIRQGYRPHPRHWQALAELVGVSANA